MKNKILAIFIVIYFIPIESMACSCVPFNVEDNFKKAIYVFEGYVTNSKVVETSGEVGPWSGEKQELVIAKYNILKSWKGNAKELEGVVTHPQSSACGVELAAGQQYTFFVYNAWNKKGLFSSANYGVITLCGTPTRVYHEKYKSTIEWLENKI